MKSPVTFIPLKEAALRWAWLGRVDYPLTEHFQKDIERQRRAGAVPDTLLLLEHPHVYTLGRSALEADILINEFERRQRSVAVYRTDRGGQVTYHGPGQLVGYLILDLRKRGLSVPRFVWLVEEALRQWIKTLGLQVERSEGQPGLWYQKRKLVSLGFHVSRGISRHGFALNLAPDLRYFNGIIACGQQQPITTLRCELGRCFDVEQVAPQIATTLDQVFSSEDSSSADSELSATSSS